MGYFTDGELVVDEFRARWPCNTVKASRFQDINEHWDIEIEYFLFGRKKVDVKGLKKQNRSDEECDETFHWVEVSSVKGGKRTGSLYGMADLFAFQTKDYWVMVDKFKLQEFIEDKCKGKKLEKTKNPYTLYRRDGRKDIIIKVKTIDLFYIADRILLRDKNYKPSDEQTDNEK